jgi:hypothetical protein
MLRWTCRLRDLLESRSNYCIDKGLISTIGPSMREAELVSGRGDLSWESFLKCFHGKETAVTLYNTESPDSYLAPVFEPGCQASQSIRSLSGQEISDLHEENVSVLWLTDDIFITSFYFSVRCSGEETASLHSYEVELQLRRIPTRTLYFCVGSLSAFETVLEEHSHGPVTFDLPLAFLRRLTKSLPSDYFASLTLTRNRDNFPVEYFSEFLSILPYDAPCNDTVATAETTWTQFKLQRGISNEDLRAICSHQFHCRLQLAFSQTYPFDGPLGEISDTLRDCPHLRALVAPTKLVEFPYQGDSFAKNQSLESLELSHVWEPSKLTLQLLDDIAANPTIREVKISFHVLSYQTDQQHIPQKLEHFVRRVLCAHSSLRRLSICFRYDPDDLGTPFEDARSLFMSCGLDSFGTFTTLCFFNLYLERHHGYSLLPLTQNLARISWWDKAISPSLVLNFYREYLPNNVTARVSPLAIRAVNTGAVYCKTSHHVPHDLSVANAGLIFYILQKGALLDDED